MQIDIYILNNISSFVIKVERNLSPFKESVAILVMI